MSQTQTLKNQAGGVSAILSVHSGSPNKGHRYLFSVRNLLSWCMKLNPKVILLSVFYPADKAKRGHRSLPLWPQL